MTLSDLIRNSLDSDFSLDWSAADLGELMMEQEPPSKERHRLTFQEQG